MTTSDYIALGALLVSGASFLYTWYLNNENNKRTIKKDQFDYLKQISRKVNDFYFEQVEDDKQNIYNQIREDLTYCSCYLNNSNFKDFSCDMDDTIFVLYESKNKEDFNKIKSQILLMIETFKNNNE